jgi:Sigma-70 region 2.
MRGPEWIRGMSSQDSKLTTSDTELIESARSGDTSAFAELWRRHYRSAARVARQFTSSIDADDLVSEAYARIFQRVLAGGGPTGAFRPLSLYDHSQSREQLGSSLARRPGRRDRGIRRRAHSRRPGIVGPRSHPDRESLPLASRPLADRALVHRGRGDGPARGRSADGPHRQRRRRAVVPSPAKDSAPRGCRPTSRMQAPLPSASGRWRGSAIAPGTA